MTERRYSDEEVAAIFAQATERQHATPRELTPGNGMTLAELQDIGREVGIAPEVVAEVAQSLQARPPRAPRFLGLPLGVAHTVELGRKMTDDEWDRLVVDLRETFEARGKLQSEGSFRQWTNGNLQVLLEPSGAGHRVRFKTIKGGARALMTTGLGVIGVSGALVVASVATGALEFGAALSGVTTMLLMGAAFFGIGAAQLPGWARLRRQQMEELAARLLKPR